MGIANTCEPARTVPLAPWLAFAVNVFIKSGAGADLRQGPSRRRFGLPPPARSTTARPDHAGKSGARDGAWNAAEELKFARM